MNLNDLLSILAMLLIDVLRSVIVYPFLIVRDHSLARCKLCSKSEVKRFGETRLSKPLHFAFIAFFRSLENSSLPPIVVSDCRAYNLSP